MLIALSQLVAHPLNSNVMAPVLLAKLEAHIRDTGRYPSLIVRPFSPPPMAGGMRNNNPRVSQDNEHEENQNQNQEPPTARGGLNEYQVLDGHHRRTVLEKLGHAEVHCEVWECDDAQAAMLLSTLNRLQGRDDPYKRAQLVRQLRAMGHTAAQLARLMPDRAHRLRKLIELHRPVRCVVPKTLDEMSVAVHFFLTGAQRRTLEEALQRQGGPREEALMKLVAPHENAAPERGAPPTTRGAPPT